MFARVNRKPGTSEYEDYYAERASLRVTDDKIRALPKLLEPGGRYYDPKISNEAAKYFRMINGSEADEEAAARWSRRVRESSRPASVLKAMAGALGAVAAGCTAVDERFVYSHKGRFDRDYGKAIDAREHRYAIVFLVEMDHGTMRHAPRVAVTLETARQYYRAAVIAKTIQATLSSLEERAVAQYDEHYDVILPPLAVAAGLGELGRNNILVADRYGSRVRIGAVTTTLSLDQDTPRSLGVGAFCDLCKKCSDNCPTGALSSRGRSISRGEDTWETKVEKCYAYWRRIGTDCGVCMAVCPFSHKDGWFHNAVRAFVKVHGIAARIALYGDDLVYGRTWKTRGDPR